MPAASSGARLDTLRRPLTPTAADQLGDRSPRRLEAWSDAADVGARLDELLQRERQGLLAHHDRADHGVFDDLQPDARADISSVAPRLKAPGAPVAELIGSCWR